jgi:hypothetical protein
MPPVMTSSLGKMLLLLLGAVAAAGQQQPARGQPREASRSRPAAAPREHEQCALPYTTVDDPWRSVSAVAHTGQRHRGDRPLHEGASGHPDAACKHHTPTGLGGDRWFRFVGTDDALPLRNQGGYSCGATAGAGSGGWLSGWNRTLDVHGRGEPPLKYDTPGAYPTIDAGVVEGTVCFSAGVSCVTHVDISMVRCRDFYLWRLPYAPNCWSAFCTASSGNELLLLRGKEL